MEEHHTWLVELQIKNKDPKVDARREKSSHPARSASDSAMTGSGYVTTSVSLALTARKSWHTRMDLPSDLLMKYRSGHGIRSYGIRSYGAARIN